MAGQLDLGTLFGHIELEDRYSPALSSINAKTLQSVSSIESLNIALQQTGAAALESGINFQKFAAGTAQLAVAQAQVSKYRQEFEKLAEIVRAAGAAVSNELTSRLQKAAEKFLESQAAAKRLADTLKEVERNAIAAGNAEVNAAQRIAASQSKIADTQQRLFVQQQQQQQAADFAVKQAAENSARAAQAASARSAQATPIIAGMSSVPSAASAQMISGMSIAGDQAAASLAALQKPLDSVAAGMSRAGQAASDSGRMIRGMSAAGQEAAQVAAEAAVQYKNVGTIITEVGRGMRAAGVVITTAISAPLAAAGAQSLKFASDFEASSVKVVSLAGATAEEIASLRGEILKLSTTTAINPEELNKGLFVIESAGFRGQKALDLLTQSAKMTAIGMGDVEATTRAVVGAVLTFASSGLTAEQASNQLVKTVQLGNMRVDELVSALARVNPVAAAFGLRFADVNASIATFTHLGASVDIAATGIRAVLNTMLNDSAKTEKGLKALGISMADLRDEIISKGLDVALIHLTEAASRVPGGLDKLHDVFPNIRAFVDVLATAGAQSQRYRVTTEQIVGANNTLNDSFSVTEKTFNFQLAQLKVLLHNLAIEIGTTLIPIFEKLIHWFEENVIPVIKTTVAWFEKLPEPIQEFGIALAGIAIVAGPALLFVGELTIALGHLTRAYETYTGISALTGLSRAFGTAAQPSTIMQTLAPVAASSTNVIGGAIGSSGLIGAGSRAVQVAAPAAGVATNAIGGVLGEAGVAAGAGAAIGGISLATIAGITAAVLALGLAIYELYKHWNELTEAVDKSKTAVEDAFSFSGIGDSTLLENVKKNIDEIKTSISKPLDTNWLDTLKSIANVPFEATKSILMGLYEYLKDLVGLFVKMGDIVVPAAIPVIARLIGAFKDLYKSISDLIEKIDGWSFLLPDFFSFSLIVAINKIIDAIDKLTARIGGLKGIFRELFDYLAEVTGFNIVVTSLEKTAKIIDWINNHIPTGIPSKMGGAAEVAAGNALPVPVAPYEIVGPKENVLKSNYESVSLSFDQINEALKNGSAIAGTSIDKVIVAFDKSSEASKKAKKAVDDYNKAWSDWAEESGGWFSILDTLSADQIKVIDYFLKMGDSVDKLAAKFPNLTKSQIDAVKGTERYRDSTLALTGAQKEQLNIDFSKNIPVSTTIGANRFMPKDLATAYNKDLEDQYKAIGKIIDAWDDMRSKGVTVEATIAGINSAFRDSAIDAAAAGAGVKDLEEAYGDKGLTKAQADALVRSREILKNYNAAVRRSGDDIIAIWDQVYATQEQDALRGEALQEATINKQTIREKDTIIKRFNDYRDFNNFSAAEKMDLANRLNDELAAVDALAQAKISRNRVNWQIKTDEEIRAIVLKDQEVLLDTFGSAQETALAKNEIGLNAAYKRLFEEGLLGNKTLVDATIKLYKDQAFAIIASFDPVFKSWQDLNKDMRSVNADTWGQFLDDTKTFGQAFEKTLIDSMWTPFKNILSGMIADFEQILIAPIMNYFKQVLQQGMLNWVSALSKLTGGGGASSTGGSALGGLTNMAESAGAKFAFSAIATHFGTTAAGVGGVGGAALGTGPLLGVYGASTTSAAVPASLAANPGLAGMGVGSAALVAAGIAGAGVAGWQLGKFLGGTTENKALGATMGAGAGAGTGALIGSVVPGVGTAIGALVGGIAGAISGWRAAGKLYDEVKKQQADLMDQLGGMEGEIKNVGAAYALTGHSGEEAQAALHKMWDAKTPAEFAAAVKPVAEALQIMKQNTEDLAAASVDSAGRITEAWTRVLDLNKKYGANAKEVRDFIKSQTESIVAGFNDIVAAQDQAVTGYHDIKQAVDDAQASLDKLSGKTALDELKKSGTATADEIAKAQAAVDKLLGTRRTVGGNTELDKALAALDKAKGNQAAAAAAAKPELDDLGLTAVGAYTVAVASGMSASDAIKAQSTSLTVLEQAYKDLGLEVEDVALKNLFLQNNIQKASGTTISGVKGLTQVMVGLDNIGQETAESFANQQRLGTAMYVRLQAAAAAAGGTTKDALLPMQDYLHQAEIEAKKLGVPLDAMTQTMIDQSKDLGIWKDAVTPPPTVQDAIQHLVDVIEDLNLALRGLPPKVHTTVVIDTKHTTDGVANPPSGPLGGPPEIVPPEYVPPPGYALGGNVLAMASGGVVPNLGAPKPPIPSTDTVHAMLTPGERILSVEENKLFGQLLTLTSSPSKSNVIISYVNPNPMTTDPVFWGNSFNPTTTNSNRDTVNYFAEGGIVPGFGIGDTVPAMLTPGEAVLNTDAVNAIGTNTVNALNTGKSAFTLEPPKSDNAFRNSLLDFWNSFDQDLKVGLSLLYDSDQDFGLWPSNDDGLEWVNRLALQTQGSKYEGGWADPEYIWGYLVRPELISNEINKPGIMGIKIPDEHSPEFWAGSDRILGHIHGSDTPAEPAYREGILTAGQVANYYSKQYENMRSFWPDWEDKIKESELADTKQYYHDRLRAGFSTYLGTSLSRVFEYIANANLAGVNTIDLSPETLKNYAEYVGIQIPSGVQGFVNGGISSITPNSGLSAYAPIFGAPGPPPIFGPGIGSGTGGGIFGPSKPPVPKGGGSIGSGTGGGIFGPSTGGGGSIGGIFGSMNNVRYLATGGLVKGTDTIPAMLTPGERVLNIAQNEAFTKLIGNAPTSIPTESSSTSIPQESNNSIIYTEEGILEKSVENTQTSNMPPIVVHVDARGAWFDNQGVEELSGRIQKSFWTKVQQNGVNQTMASNALNIKR